MSHLESQRVSIELKEGYAFLVRFEDVRHTPTMICDEPAPLGGGEGPNAAAVLAAAVGNCLAASLAFCLRRAHIEPIGISAAVTTNVARNDRGRLRIVGIDVAITPELASDAPAFQRCEALFEDFCTVTASIRQGIPVSVSVQKRVQSQSAA
ncbi:MAG: OsmC family protein [Vicinamibacterales bacterium]